VLDAAECDRRALFGFSEGGPISILLAGTYPERIRALIVYGSYACGSPEDDGSPERAKWIELMGRAGDTIDLGRRTDLGLGGPSLSHSTMYRRAVGKWSAPE
jgi:pimeloyl-ACP methyl ester carboxylesterase